MIHSEYSRYRIYLTWHGVDQDIVLNSVVAPSISDMLLVVRDIAVRQFRGTAGQVVRVRVVQLDSHGEETAQEIEETVLIPALE